MSMLALRVAKVDENAGHEGHDHAPPKKTKRVKGLWTVRIEPQQEAKEEMHYVWLWEGSQIKRQVYAALALLVIFAVVLYPLWPLKMRQGVYYLSWGFLMLLGLFFLMAIFRVILFCATYFTTPPGLWLFPNLWEDVSFMDSFRPVWAWHEVRYIQSCPLEHMANRPDRRKRRRRSRQRAQLAPRPPSPLLPVNPPQPVRRLPQLILGSLWARSSREAT